MTNRLDNPNFRHYFLLALEREGKTVIDAEIDAAYKAGAITARNLKMRVQVRLGAAVQRALDETNRTRFPGD